MTRGWIEDPTSMAGKIVFGHRRHQRHRQGPATGVLPRWERTWPSPVATSGARRRSQSRSGELPAIHASTRLALTCTSQAEVRRLAAEVGDLPAARRPDQQRRRVLGPPPRHGGRPGANLRVNHLAPFLLTDCCSIGSAPAPRPESSTVSSAAQSMGTIDFEDLRASAASPDSGLRPVEVGQRDVHVRAGPPPRGDRRHGDGAASGDDEHAFGAEDPSAGGGR